MSPAKPKVPTRPQQPLAFDDDDVVPLASAMFRIHSTEGRHPAEWHEFRTFGPLDRSRWDPHPYPQGQHPGYGVLYAATDYVTPFAEVFQHYRRINLSARRALAGWEPTRPLQLLDLTGNWPLRNGAAHSWQHAPRSTCRAWARAIRAQCPDDIDGLLAESTLTGEASRVVVLWEGTTDHFPNAPAVSRALNHPALSMIVLEAVRTTHYDVVRS